MSSVIRNSIFFQPFPVKGKKGAFKRLFWISVFIPIFLITFRPFGLDVSSSERIFFILGYTPLCFLVLSINAVFFYNLLKKHGEENWKVFHQMLWFIYTIFILGIINFFYAVFIGGTITLSYYEFIRFEGILFLISILPICASVFLSYYFALRKNLNNALEYTRKIQEEHAKEKKEDKDTPEVITLMAENGKDKFVSSVNDIYFIESVDNYVEIFWTKNNVLTKTLLRSTLQKLEEQTQHLPIFFRCHRSFLVNLNNVVSVNGNSQGYQLSFSGIEKTVSVARSKNKELKEFVYTKK